MDQYEQMKSDALTEFGEQLTRIVRDRAIKGCEVALEAEDSPVGNRWRDALSSGDLARTLIPDCVDEAIFALLNAIDQGQLELIYTSPSGARMDLGEGGQGELAGWFMGSSGWRRRFSQQHFNDDFIDLS